jgi:hypothetical protein
MNLEDRLQEIEARATAASMLIEYIVAPLIASHPAREEFREILESLRHQGALSDLDSAQILAGMAGRIDDRVQQHVAAMKG